MDLAIVHLEWEVRQMDWAAAQLEQAFSRELENSIPQI